jgi:hypothetical protein
LVNRRETQTLPQPRRTASSCLTRSARQKKILLAPTSLRRTRQPSYLSPSPSSLSIPLLSPLSLFLPPLFSQIYTTAALRLPPYRATIFPLPRPHPLSLVDSLHLCPSPPQQSPSGAATASPSLPLPPSITLHHGVCVIVVIRLVSVMRSMDLSYL